MRSLWLHASCAVNATSCEKAAWVEDTGVVVFVSFCKYKSLDDPLLSLTRCGTRLVQT